MAVWWYWLCFSHAFHSWGGRLGPLGPGPKDGKNERNKANAIIQPPKNKLYFVKTKFLPGPSWTSPPSYFDWQWQKKHGHTAMSISFDCSRLDIEGTTPIWVNFYMIESKVESKVKSKVKSKVNPRSNPRSHPFFVNQIKRNVKRKRKSNHSQRNLREGREAPPL